MKKALIASLLVTLCVVSVSPLGAAADPVESGEASAFGITASLAGTTLLPPTPEASVSGIGEDRDEVLVPLPVDPLAINGTLIAEASVHEESDITSALEQSTQAVAGPYNAQAVGQLEDLEVLIDLMAAGVPLLEADVLRAEAVAVCRGDAIEYSANSEVFNLVIAGQDPLSGPLNDLVNQIFDLLEPLAPVVDVDTNVVTVTDTGASVDALVVTLLSVIDPDAPLVELRIGHAEVSGATCGDGADVPECSNGIDDDGDGLVDIDDPNCHTDGDPGNPDSFDPNDDSETPECADTVDNDGDGVADAADPGCHSDGDADDGDDTYVADDDSELAQCADGIDNDGDGLVDFGADPECTSVDDETEGPDGSQVAGNVQQPGGALPDTGMSVATGMAAMLGLGALGLLALRRRALA